MKHGMTNNKGKFYTIEVKNRTPGMGESHNEIFQEQEDNSYIDYQQPAAVVPLIP